MHAQPAPERNGHPARVWTVPNVLSFARLACVPLFLWLLFGKDTRLGAAVLLAGLGTTDWVDGYIARRFDQTSELGKVLDPTADRIMLVVAVVALAVDGVIPAVVFWPVAVREVLISMAVLALAAMGVTRIDVLWVGKAGAFALMVAFPLYLLAEAGLDVSSPWDQAAWEAAAWVCAVPGVVLSYAAAWHYARRVPGALRERNEPRAGQPETLAATAVEAPPATTRTRE